MGLYNTFGIYCITNMANNKKYIGCTTNSVGDRKDSHLYALRNNKHVSKSLQYDYNMYGEDSFEFSVLEEFRIYDLQDNNVFEKEKYYIELYDTINNGYNTSVGGKGGATGTKRDPEISKKVGEINRKRMTGNKLSDETKKKISKGNKGKKMSDEAKAKISIANRGKTHTLERRIASSERANKKITYEQARLVKQMLTDGNRVKDISEKLDIPTSIISDIKRGKTYKLA